MVNEIAVVEKEVKKISKNYWAIAAIVLAVLLIVVLIFSSTSGISKSKAGQIILSFAESRGANATLSQVYDNGSVYEVVLSVSGQDVPLYITKDGKNLIDPQGIFPLASLTQTANTGNAATGNAVSQTSTPVEIPISNSPVLGNASAKLTIVEFSDFSCPFCGAASGDSLEYVKYMQDRDSTWEAPIPGIIKDYVNTGKAKLVFKYSMGHTGGKPAMLVGLCLNDQNLFWKFHDKAFANQSAVEDLTAMKNIAQSLGANIATLQTCLDSKKYDSKLVDDQNLANSINIGGTPAIYVNGIQASGGAISYTDLKPILDAQLTKLQ